MREVVFEAMWDVLFFALVFLGILCSFPRLNQLIFAFKNEARAFASGAKNSWRSPNAEEPLS